MAFTNFLSRFRRRADPTKWAGSAGFSIYAGHIDQGELDRELANHDSRYRRFSSILTNTSIVAASVRYFLNLVSRSAWTFSPSEDDTDGFYAELLEEILTKDIKTPWHRVVRRAAMYRFYGFAVQEWRAMRRDDGRITYYDIRPRPQHTIERWDVDPESYEVLGMIQQRAQDQEQLYIPRDKVLYVVDDSLSDAPDGMGIFRHLAAPAAQLKRYEQLEGFGFELDLRNIPVGRVPLAQLQEAVSNGNLTQDQANAFVAPIKNFISNHIKNPQLGLMLDSKLYQAEDDAARPTNTPLYGMELLSGTQTSLPEAAAAINRINMEMARILGTEQLLLGGGNTGSYALSQDKTNQFYLLVEGSLTEVRETVDKDLVNRIWDLNGWPRKMKPEMRTEAIRPRDIGEVTASLRDLATAGAPLEGVEDPAALQVRDLMNLERPLEPDDVGRLIRGIADDPDPKQDDSIDDPDEE